MKRGPNDCNCGVCLNKKLMTAAEFKKVFKVGDIIGWPTGKVARITAIGEKRFLFHDERMHYTKEGCASMENTFWVKWTYRSKK